MGLKDRIASKFKRLFFGNTVVVEKDVYTRPVGRSIVVNILNAINRISRFDEINQWDAYEDMYAYEPEIGGAIDRLSSLVALSYKGFTLKYVGETIEEDEARLLELAQKIDEHYNFRDLFEVLAELLLIHGNVYIHIKKSRSGFPTLRILPNKYVTVVDDKDRVNRFDTYKVITTAKYYVVNEGKYKPEMPIEIIPASDIIHIKYKNTPVFIKDKFGRPTFGIYSISPLMRAVFPVLWKRETMVIDILWRYRNVPREHHVISSKSFDLRNYTGTIQERLEKAKKDAERVLAEYTEMIKSQEPDQGYVTLDNVEIRRIDASSGKYAQPNELIEQMTDHILMALNLPQSIVKGVSRGSYASELVQMGYLTTKVLRIAEKIKDALLKFTKELILKIDETLPVHKLDMKLELILERNRMEQFRMAAIMADLGCFTSNEIRKFLGYPELPDLAGQILTKDKSRKAGDKTVKDVVADELKRTEPEHHVMTPHSEEQTKKPQ